MTPKKPKSDAATIAADAVTDAAEAVSSAADAAKIAAANSAWKQPVYTAVGIALVSALQVLGLAWLDSRNNTRAIQQQKEVKIVKGQVEEIHKSTNSMKDALVKATEKEALARGGVEERERADARKDKKDEKDDTKK